MPIEIEFEGTVHEFPDDFSDADIAAALGSGGEPAKPMPQSGASIRPRDPGIIDRVKDAALNAEGVPGIIVGAATQGMNSVAQLGDLARAGWNMLAPDSLEVDRPAQAIENIPAMNEWQQLGQRGVQAAELATGAKGLAVGASKTPGIIARGLGISKERAAANMTAAATAAKDAKVATTGTREAVERAKALQGTGSRPARVVRQFETRINQAERGELSFQEAQDFVSSMSRMSANEYTTLNPQMQRQVIVIRDALRQALTDAADTVGAGDQYARGVSEYARAARAAARWEDAKPRLVSALKTGAKWAVGGAGLSYGASKFGN